MIEIKKYRIIIVFIVGIILIASMVGWTIIKSENNFSMTVLNLSGKELFVYLKIGNSSESEHRPFGDLLKVFVTGNGIQDNESRQFTYETPYKDIVIIAESRNYSIDEETIAYETFNFQGSELYDLLVIVQDSGERITIIKKP